MRWRPFLVLVTPLVACRRDERPRPDVVSSVVKSAAVPSASVSPLPTSVPGYDPPIVAACADYARRYCKYRSDCSEAYVAAAYGDVRRCEVTSFWSCAFHRAPPSSSLEATTLTRCLGETMAHGCDEKANTDPSCSPPGTLADGAACRSWLQCRSSNCADVVDGCGVCRPRGDAGVEVPATLGASCTKVECAHPLTCVKGKCVRPAKVGEACAKWSGALPACEYPFGRCDETIGKCVRAQFAALGDPCELSDDCAGRSHCSEKRCVAAPSYGDSCANDAACPYPMQCVKDVCALPRPCK